jgi:hypothetical protein
MRWAFVLGACGMLVGGCGGEAVSRAVGARCDLDRECDERCLAPGADYPGGFCTVSCDTTPDCPGDAVCADLEGGVCLFNCVGDADCGFLGTAWTCQVVDRRPGPGTVKVCRGG